MDNSDYSRNRGGNDYLGVKKMGKNIRKSPLQQPSSYTNPPPQPQVYNINKNDFQSIVQQLTGSPSRQEPVSRPPQKSPSMPMQRSRPSSLTPLNVTRPRMPIHHAPVQQHNAAVSSGAATFNASNLARVPVESPISAYMRYLQHSIMDPAQGPQQAHPQPQSQSQYPQAQQPSSGLLPSPSGYLNLLSPLSPYPLLSPGYQHPPPLSPNFLFSPMTQPQPPPSPGMGFPSPGFFSFASPRWRD